MFEEIELVHADVRARVAPGRGALATQLSVGGIELLYLDRQTFDDPSQNVHGGIPLLFPFASRLDNNTLLASNTSIGLHGFARTKKWTIAEQTQSFMRMQLTPDDEARAIFPWDFLLEHNILLTSRGLHLELQIQNLSDRPMPVAPGWHPYLPCPANRKAEVAGDIKGAEPGSVHDHEIIDFGVVPRIDGRANFFVPAIGNVRLEFSPEMRHLQIWTVPGRNFVCLEPFTGPPNFINTKNAHHVAPGEARTYWMRMELLKAGKL